MYPSLDSPYGLATLILLIVPGFVYNSTISRFVVMAKVDYQVLLLRCITFGSVNFAVFFPIMLYFEPSGRFLPSLAFIMLFVSPVLFGFLAGLSQQFDWGYKILRWLRLQPIHPTVTAWDWKFSRCAPAYVIVTLKDGSQVAGLLGEKSFISSDIDRDDIYIEQVFEIEESGKWKCIPGKSILITRGETRWIEFWPAT